MGWIVPRNDGDDPIHSSNSARAAPEPRRTTLERLRGNAVGGAAPERQGRSHHSSSCAGGAQEPWRTR